MVVGWVEVARLRCGTRWVDSCVEGCREMGMKGEWEGRSVLKLRLGVSHANGCTLGAQLTRR